MVPNLAMNNVEEPNNISIIPPSDPKPPANSSRSTLSNANRTNLGGNLEVRVEAVNSKFPFQLKILSNALWIKTMDRKANTNNKGIWSMMKSILFKSIILNEVGYFKYVIN